MNKAILAGCMSLTSVVLSLRAIFAVMNTTLAVVKMKLEKNSGLYGIQMHDLCDTGVVLYCGSHIIMVFTSLQTLTTN